MKQAGRWSFVIALLAVAVFLSLFIGPSGFSLANASVMTNLRLPRLLLGIVAGGVLAFSGTALQGLLGNPLVDPYTLKKQGMVEVTSFQMCDVGVRHPSSFAAIQDATLS